MCWIYEWNSITNSKLHWFKMYSGFRILNFDTKKNVLPWNMFAWLQSCYASWLWIIKMGLYLNCSKSIGMFQRCKTFGVHMRNKVINIAWSFFGLDQKMVKWDIYFWWEPIEIASNTMFCFEYFFSPSLVVVHEECDACATLEETFEKLKQKNCKLLKWKPENGM